MNRWTIEVGLQSEDEQLLSAYSRRQPGDGTIRSALNRIAQEAVTAQVEELRSEWEEQHEAKH